jgi:phosphoribosyl-AMP cyclohydrolase / phosphoribosyl-ATP pyrophosphohydrolase
MIIPSIDLMNGKAVQLQQGNAERKMVEVNDPLKLAKEFRKYGEIAVIDLDAALGKGDNLKVIKEICKIAECRVGGGIRSVEKANQILAAGAKRIIIGTKATPEFLKQLPKERLIAAIDTKNGFVATEGWKKETKQTPFEKIKELEAYCSEFLFTNVNVEGLLQGCDLNIVKDLKKITQNKLTIAGGITTVNDVKRLEELNCNSQIGMAIYTGKLSLIDAFTSVLNFQRNMGFVPTIVQDETSQILMFAYSSKESIKKTFTTGKGTYYSRSRQELWTKGSTSGNTQEFIKARYDCDRDALIFTVKQRNVVCHMGDYSCFDMKQFSLEELYGTILERKNNPREESYTSKLMSDESMIKEKIREESVEVINYTDKNNLIWELADLTYFMMALMVKNEITPNDVKNELWRRRRRR